jgi:hypothetical protein
MRADKFDKKVHALHLFFSISISPFSTRKHSRRASAMERFRHNANGGIFSIAPSDAISITYLGDKLRASNVLEFEVDEMS